MLPFNDSASVRIARNDLNDGETIVLSEAQTIVSTDNPRFAFGADFNDDGLDDLLLVQEALACGDSQAGDCCSANDSPYCNFLPCCQEVCKLDPMCCEVAWDSTCAEQALDLPICDCGNSSGNCCEANDSSGCEDPDCEAAVCKFDSFCCDTVWDESCADQAAETPECDCVGCGDSSAGDCCAANESPYCNNNACCEAVCAFDPFCCEHQWDSICADEAADDPNCDCGGVQNSSESGASGGNTLSVHLAVPPNVCPADFNDDAVVGVQDLLDLLAAWGACASCPEDIDGDASVGVSDLLQLLAAWGECL